MQVNLVIMVLMVLKESQETLVMVLPEHPVQLVHPVKRESEVSIT